jgi:hypothetical protein
MARTLPTFSALVVLLLLAACDSADESPLVPGEFRATADGAVEGRYDGEASFAEEATPFDTVLYVRLKTGEYQIPGRTYTTSTGVFLGLSWAGEPGTYPLFAERVGVGNVTLPSDRTFGYPVTYFVESGAVTVTQASSERVEGTFEVVAVDRADAGGAAPSVRVQGEFVAVHAVEP